jgi:hypothetical protein
MISLLSVGMSKIRSIKEFDPEYRTLYQIAIEMVPSTMKSEYFCVKQTFH